MKSPDPRTAPGFVLDLDLCVECHACVVACANENRLAPGRSWREVVSFNPDHLPALRTYHLSLACNHCLDAPCLEGCPALAIARDDRTGAVILDGTKCIGCRYCSMVCPFDAPRFNGAGRVMEKCSFCNERLLRNERPACAAMCPTGALASGVYAGAPLLDVEGFPSTRFRPAISFKPLRGRIPHPPPPGVAVPDPEEYLRWIGDVPLAESKVSLKSEWPLALFSFIAIGLVAWSAGSLAGGMGVEPLLFGGAGLVALALSALHLGRKERGWRAILNLRRSWLSREVVLFPLFLGVTLVGLPSVTGAHVIAGVGGVLGLLTLVAIDRVYEAMARARHVPLDDAAALLSFAFLSGFVAENPWLIGIAGVLRAGAFLDRRWRERQVGGGGVCAHVLGLVRGSLLVAAPAAWWIGVGQPWLPLLFAGIGELVDRLDFYRTLIITSPGRKVSAALNAALTRSTEFE